MLATDPYGNFIPGPHGPAAVRHRTTGLVEGDTCGQRCERRAARNVAALRHAVPDRHRAQRRPDRCVRQQRRPRAGRLPTPDADNTPSADFANQPAGTYDDEMLNAHFACGDGRCNENIALTTIHQIFHSEHNRLVDDITTTLNANPALLAAFQAPHQVDGDAGPTSSYGFGERLFQAARFVTEMEYQHLVFEEFARKMQSRRSGRSTSTPRTSTRRSRLSSPTPSTASATPCSTTTSPARTRTRDGSKADNSLPLLTAFLNPPEYFNKRSTRHIRCTRRSRRPARS